MSTSSVSSFPIFTVLSCLVEDAFAERHTHIPLFLLTNKPEAPFIHNLDDEEDGIGATGISAFDTSRLGLWLPDFLLDGSIVLFLSCICAELFLDVLS